KLCASGCCAATATYNMAAKKPAASLIGQLRTSSCPTLARTLIHEPPDEGFVDRAVPLGGPDHLLDDHAVGADDPGLGDARGLVPGMEIRRPRSDAEQVDLGTDLHCQRGPE